MKTPKVTVLMPVYNGEKYLREAIESILNQHFTDFEFLIINDGSTDSSADIISSYSDSRIRIINNEQNIGLVNTLNKGLKESKGEYIARMDCDDVSVRKRLSVQVKFMEKNKNVGVSGSNYYVLRGNKKAIADLPISEKEIRCFMLFNCPIAHPTAIMRADAIRKNDLNYSSEFKHSEDYDLWSHIADKYGIINLSEPLLNYRMHNDQITGNLSFALTRYESVNSIRSRHIQKLGIIPSSEELKIHNLLSDAGKPVGMDQVELAQQWLSKLVIINNEKKVFDKHYFEKIVLERWMRLCFNFFKGKKAFGYFYDSELYKITDVPLKIKLELLRGIYYSWKRLKIKK